MASRTKLIILAVVAVVLPTTIISVLQYRSLAELELQTKLAASENLRQAGSLIANGTEDYFRQIAIKAFDGVPADQVADRFQHILDTMPEVDSVFLLKACSCGTSEKAILRTRKTMRDLAGKDVARNSEVNELLHLHEKALMVASSQPGMKRDYLFAYAPGCERYDFRSYVFYQLTDSKGNGIGVAGLQLSSKHILNAFIPNILSSFVDAKLGIGIRDERNKMVFATRDQQTYQLQMGLAPVFPQWTLGVDYRNASIAEIARENFRRSLLFSAIVLSFLIVGIVLTLRAAGREMRLAEAKSAFVSNVSHELKTPLALIRLFAETLELGRVKSPEKAQEYYHIINNESSRLTRLINNILDFSKIEAGRKQYEFERADAGGIVGEVVRSYECAITNEGFQLRTRIEPDLPPVLVDRAAICQAVLNLLNNAVKYSDAQKQIDVSVSRADDKIAIEVRDQGIGIPQSEQRRIFDKFYRISNGLLHERRGTGLGLTLVKHIVDAHKGDIHVSSSPGKGSTFTILVPAYESPDCRG
jgi:signal transduction histidine kinase